MSRKSNDLIPGKAIQRGRRKSGGCSDTQILDSMVAHLDITGKKEAEIALKARTSALSDSQEGLTGLCEARDKMEKALRQSESKYRTLVESMLDGVFVVQDGIVKFANRSMADTLGYEVHELLGMGIPALIAPEDRQRVLEQYRMWLSGNDAQGQSELKALHKNGNTSVFVKISLAPIDYEGGKATLGTARDITKQKLAEASLRESEEQFRRIAENMRDIVIELDETGRIRYASPSYRPVLGYDPADLIGRSTFERIHPDDLGAMIAGFQESMVKGTPRGVTFRYRHASGHYVWLQSHGNLLFDQNGRITGVVISSRDITKAKMAEEALRESEARFRSLAESTSDWIWEVDSSGRYTYTSPNVTQLLGYKPDEVIGKLPSDFMPPDEAKWLNSFIRVIKEVGKPFSGVEKVHLHKDGHRVVFESCGIPTADAMGVSKGCRGLDREVTQKKSLEAQAIRVRHLASIGELAAGVAHEINNPITGIINYAQIMIDEAVESGGDAEIPGRIVKEGERIATIVKNLLSFAKESRAEKQPIQILPPLEDSVALMASLFRKDGIQLKIEIPEDIPLIVANRREIQQVFLNILMNSRYALNKKYSGFHEEKMIKITAEQRISSGTLMVRMIFFDTGTGISPEVLNRIFDPFFSTRSPDEASGLGLSITYGIMKDHRGNIDVESTEGECTKVTLDFPTQIG